MCYWVGQRKREERDKTPDQIVDPDIFPGAEISEDEWLKRQLEKDDDNENPYEKPFATETEVGRVAAMRTLDVQQPHRIDLHLIQPGDGGRNIAGIEGVEPRVAMDYHFERANGKGTLSILNAKAVDRKGDPRHTTASCAKEWLERYSPKEGARILIVSGNPHTERTVADVIRVIKQLGREDLVYDDAGTDSLHKGVNNLSFALGEIGRLLYSEFLRKES